MSHSLYTAFYKDKVYLCPNPKFLTKMVPHFHVNQAINLLSFFLKPHGHNDEVKFHTLDVKALEFYLDRIKQLTSSLQLFMAVADRMKGLPVSSQRISFWISSSICLCYDLANVAPPSRVIAHSTRSKAASLAFLAQVPILDICKVTMWTPVHTFVSHYARFRHSRDDARFGCVVLQALFR